MTSSRVALLRSPLLLPLLLLALLLFGAADASGGGGGKASRGDTGGGECPHSSRAVAGDRRGDARSLTFATFNTEWTFDGIDDPSPSPRAGNPAEARAHLNAVAKVIAAIDADVVNLVEVEGCGTLRQLVAAATAVNPATSGDYRPYLVQGTDVALGQQVGMLTRVDPVQDLWRSERRVEYPVPGSACNYTRGTRGGGGGDSGGGTTRSTTGASKHYFARLRVGRKNVTVAGVHLKAFPTDPASCAKREAQAAVVAAELRACVAAGDEIVLMGDLNDFSDVHPDAAGSKPVSRVMATLRDLDGDGEDDLVEMMGLIEPKSERFTARWYRRSTEEKRRQKQQQQQQRQQRVEVSQLDHVLVSKGLLTGGHKTGGCGVGAGTKKNAEEAEEAAKVEVRVHRGWSADDEEGGVSDHWPMVVKISFTPGGVFTDEEDDGSWTEYWTRKRGWRVFREMVFCAVFFSGVYTLARGIKGPPGSLDRFFGFGGYPKNKIKK